ncbi:MAG: roadblock/LC7 domain-containing protein [Candidatus Sericytochromatia bacterium]|nr:roadblock/LC7 domain-containing protein [Candidatus Sericytochromatia bacterium]
MAGRRPPSEQNLLTMLLAKLGLGSVPPPRKKRRKRQAAEGFEGHVQAATAEEDSPFAGFGAQPGLMDPAQTAPEPAWEPPPAPAEEPEAKRPAGGRLFEEAALDSSLDALFSGLESGLGNAVTMPPEASALAPSPPSPEPEVAPGQAPAEAPPAAREPRFDEFGLSSPVPLSAAAPTPPAPGSTRVIHSPIVAPGPAPAPVPAPPPPPRPAAPVVPPSLRSAPALSGQVSDVLPLSRGVDLQAVLGAVAAVPGVGGALIVGHDGLLIAARLPGGVDAESLGAQACALFTGADEQAGRLGRGGLRRMLLETANGAMLLTAADMGILVVASLEGQQMDLGAVVAAIRASLGQGA